MGLGIGLSKIIDRLKNTFFVSPLEKKLFKKFICNKKNSKKKDVILLQTVEDYYYFSLFGAIVKNLKCNIKNEPIIMQYNPRNLSVGTSQSIIQAVKSFLFHNKLRDKKWNKLYSSYCDKVAFRNESSTSLFYDIKAFLHAYKIYKTLKTKDDLLNLKINNLIVGDLIYDTYLRYKPAATVNMNDKYIIILLWKTLRNIKNASHFINKYNVRLLLTSYSTYIQHGIVVRIALEHDIEVISFGDYGTFYTKLTKDYWFHTKNCRNYKNDFKKIQSHVDLTASKKALEDRFNGKIDVATSYMKKSAYQDNDEEVPNVKGKVVIFLHDFFDSPHIYGTMLFPDFYEWFLWTVKVLNDYSIPFCIKEHPNQISDSKQVVKELEEKYPDLEFISTKITNKTLVEHGIIAGVSIYGTVAHELSYLGIPVVLCGENPHSSYSFTFEAKNLEEYNKLLKNVKHLTLPTDVQYEVESFYYMHNLNHTKEMLKLLNILSSLRHICLSMIDSEYIKWKNILEDLFNNVEFQLFISKLKREFND